MRLLLAALLTLAPAAAFADMFGSAPPPPALSGVVSQFLNGTGQFSVPSGAGSTGNVVGSGATVVGHAVCWSNTSATGGIDCGIVPAKAGANSDITSLSGLTTPLSVLQGGTGTATPGIVAGTNVTVTGTWPNQTVNSTGGGSGGTPANPSATAGPTAVNGSASTYMRSDASPAVQKAGAAQFGIIEPDNATMLCPSGVCSTTLTDTVHTSGTVTTANIGGEDDYASGAAGATLATLASGQSLLVADISAGALPIGLNGQTVAGCPLPTSLHNAGFYAFTFNSASTVSCYGNPGYVTITTGALTKFVDGSGALTAATAADLPATPLLTGTSTSLVGPRQYYVCTSTCTVTPPVPAAGYEFCVQNDVGVSTVITMAAIGSSARYGKTDQSAYGTAGTGTFISGGAAGDKICLLGKDATHYNTASSNGSWTAN